MKRSSYLSLCITLICLLSLFSCNRGERDTLGELEDLKERFSSSLSPVNLYTSSADEGDALFIDQGLVAALLGDDGIYPPELSGVEEYSFFCASSVELCEVWIASCRTYSGARALARLFEERRQYLQKKDFDSESDAKAAESARVICRQKTVYFVCTSCGEDVVEYITNKD